MRPWPGRTPYPHASCSQRALTELGWKAAHPRRASDGEPEERRSARAPASRTRCGTGASSDIAPRRSGCATKGTSRIPRGSVRRVVEDARIRHRVAIVGCARTGTSISVRSAREPVAGHDTLTLERASDARRPRTGIRPIPGAGNARLDGRKGIEVPVLPNAPFVARISESRCPIVGPGPAVAVVPPFPTRSRGEPRATHDDNQHDQ
jgi:hypothetical protein